MSVGVDGVEEASTVRSRGHLPHCVGEETTRDRPARVPRRARSPCLLPRLAGGGVAAGDGGGFPISRPPRAIDGRITNAAPSRPRERSIPPLSSGVSSGRLRPADGRAAFGAVGHGGVEGVTTPCAPRFPVEINATDSGSGECRDSEASKAEHAEARSHANPSDRGPMRLRSEERKAIPVKPAHGAGDCQRVSIKFATERPCEPVGGNFSQTVHSTVPAVHRARISRFEATQLLNEMIEPDVKAKIIRPDGITRPRLPGCTKVVRHAHWSAEHPVCTAMRSAARAADLEPHIPIQQVPDRERSDRMKHEL